MVRGSVGLEWTGTRVRECDGPGCNMEVDGVHEGWRLRDEGVCRDRHTGRMMT